MLQNVYQEQNVSCFSGLCPGGTVTIGQKRCQTVLADMFLSRGSAAWHSSCGQAWIWNIKPVKGFTSVRWYKFHLKFRSHPIRAQLTLWGYRWHGFWVYCRGCCEQTDDDDVWEESGLSYDPSLDKPQGHLAELVIQKKMRDGCLHFFIFTDKDGFLHIF